MIRDEEARNLIKELEDKLVEKSYLSARLYYDMEQYRAAITALSNSLKEYPETKYREEMLFLEARVKLSVCCKKCQRQTDGEISEYPG